MIKANSIYSSWWDGQELADSKNEQIEPTIANGEKTVAETNQRVDSVETYSSGGVLLQGQQQVHIQSIQNQDQVQNIPESMHM